jgi:hypothetical protein
VLVTILIITVLYAVVSEYTKRAFFRRFGKQSA